MHGLRISKASAEKLLKQQQEREPNRTHGVQMYINRRRKEYFFVCGTLDQWQRLVDEGWVAVSSGVPMEVVARESLPSGVIRSIDDMLTIFNQGQTEAAPTWVDEYVESV